MGLCNNNCKIMPACSYWLVIDVVSMVISHIGRAHHPAPPIFFLAYIKWDKALTRIINKYISAFSSDPDCGKPLSKIGNLAYLPYFVFINRYLGIFQISNFIWLKLSRHVRILVYFWKKGENDGNRWYLVCISAAFLFWILQTLCVLRITSKVMGSYNSTYLYLSKAT